MVLLRSSDSNSGTESNVQQDVMSTPVVPLRAATSTNDSNLDINDGFGFIFYPSPQSWNYSLYNNEEVWDTSTPSFHRPFCRSGLNCDCENWDPRICTYHFTHECECDREKGEDELWNARWDYLLIGVAELFKEKTEVLKSVPPEQGEVTVQHLIRRRSAPSLIAHDHKFAICRGCKFPFENSFSFDLSICEICGVNRGTGETLKERYERLFPTDPQAYGTVGCPGCGLLFWNSYAFDLSICEVCGTNRGTGLSRQDRFARASKRDVPEAPDSYHTSGFRFFPLHIQTGLLRDLGILAAQFVDGLQDYINGTVSHNRLFQMLTAMKPTEQRAARSHVRNWLKKKDEEDDDSEIYWRIRSIFRHLFPDDWYNQTARSTRELEPDLTEEREAELTRIEKTRRAVILSVAEAKRVGEVSAGLVELWARRAVVKTAASVRLRIQSLAIGFKVISQQGVLDLLYKYAKTLSLFFVEISLHRSPALFVIQCGRLLKDLLPAEWWEEFSETVWNGAKEMIFGSVPISEIKAEGDESTPLGKFVEKLVSAKQSVVDFSDSVIFGRFMRFVTSVIGCALSFNMGIATKMVWCLPKGYKVPTGEVSTADLILNLVGSTVDIIGAGYQQYILGRKSISHTGAEYRLWLQRRMDIERELANFSANAQSVDYDALCAELQDLYDTGKEMIATVETFHPRLLNMVSREFKYINEMFIHHVVMGSCGSRKAPIAIKIVGPSGVGKSGVATSIFTLASQVCNLSPAYKPGDEFVISPTSPFMDGVEAKVNGYWLLDDAGQWKYVQGKVPEDIAQVIMCANSQPYPLNMAFAKGQYWGAPQVVLVTSNKYDLGANNYFNTAAAVARRFLCTLYCEVKPEYQSVVDGKLTGQLDPTKLDGSEDDLAHLNITIYRAVLEPKHNPVHGNYDSNVLEKKVYNGSWWPTAAGEEGATVVLTSMMKEFQASQNKYRVSQRNKLNLRYDESGVPQHLKEYDIKPEGNPIVELTWWGNCLFILLAVVGLDRLFDLSRLPGRIRTLRSTIANDILMVQAASANVRETATHTAQVVESKLKAFEILGLSIEKRILDATSVFFKSFRNILLSLGGTAVLYQLVSLMKDSTGPRAEGNTLKRVKKVPEVVKAKPNYYDSVVSRSTMPHFSMQTLTSTFDEVLPHFEHAVSQVTLIRRESTGPVAIDTVCFCVRGVDYIFATHTIAPFLTNTDVVQITFREDGTNKKDFTLQVDMKYHASDGDVTLVRIPGKLQKKNLSKFLLASYGDSLMPGSLVKPSTSVRVVVSKHTPIIYDDKRGNRWTVEEPLKYSHSDPGSCGAPLVLNVKNPGGSCGLALAGVHVAGDNARNVGFAAPLTLELVDSLVAKIDAMGHWPSVSFAAEADTKIVKEILEDDVDSLSIQAEGASFVFSEPNLRLPHPKNSVWFTQNCGTVEILGEIDRHVGRPSTDVRPSLIHDDVAEVLGDTEYTRPLMQKKWMERPDGTRFYNNPYLTALEQITEYPVEVNPREVDACVKSYLNRVLSLLPDGVFDDVSVLSDAEALNGIVGEEYIKGVKRNTSGGYGLFQSKKKAGCYEPDPSEEYPDGIKMSPDMQSWADDIWETLGNEAVGAVFQAHLKNEPRVMKEDGSVKTARLFTGTPAAWSHAVRRLYLPIIGVIQTYGLVFETAVGVNAASADWEALYDHIVKFGQERVVEGDFSKFDKYNTSYVVLSAFRVLITLMRESGYLPEDLCRAWNIAYDSAVPTVLLDRVLYILFASFPSGHPATVIINGISNSIYIRLCWLRAGYDLDEFDDSVSFLSYGDDNIFSVKEGVDFSFAKVSSLMAEFGMKYTLPDKSTEARTYSRIWDCSFLKRGFRCADGRVYAPLDESSLRRRLMLTYDSSLSDEEQARVTLLESLFDSWHYGEAKYERYRSLALRLFSKYDLGTPKDVPTFAEYSARMEPKYAPGASRVVPV